MSTTLMKLLKRRLNITVATIQTYNVSVRWKIPNSTAESPTKSATKRLLTTSTLVKFLKNPHVLLSRTLPTVNSGQSLGKFEVVLSNYLNAHYRIRISGYNRSY
ncbi:hypothetical protein WICPIJ_005992 [Wickerhamomyces pijperi]|uniref:Uncharacterized protein n=1 Tax=Wickerhamomyces pijperi TaxID=599730 RepID=A0A9P8Q2G4_WICPI|nr:hypothetical protein WICPIJ_005992 [Wickerhamomyces pijperi]